jgi:hypothetical protein
MVTTFCLELIPLTHDKKMQMWVPTVRTWKENKSFSVHGHDLKLIWKSEEELRN